jgi:hypothetical protein
MDGQEIFGFERSEFMAVFKPILEKLEFLTAAWFIFSSKKFCFMGLNIFKKKSAMGTST